MERSNKSVVIGQYLISKNGAKYIKFENRRTRDGVPASDAFPLTIGEGDILFLNLHDEEFREKHNIPEFVRGTISMVVPTLPEGNAPVGKPRSKPAGRPATTEGDEF